MHEVLVVGAGPAGAATAIHLARHGRNVVLVDRAHFPRRKVCGEGIFPAGVRELDQLGILPGISEQISRLRRVRFTLDDVAVEGSFAGEAIGVDRGVLDTALVAAARDSGVDVREGMTVRSLVFDNRGAPIGVATDDGLLEARGIVAADGLNSRLARDAGLHLPETRHVRYGISAHVQADIDTEAVDVRFRDGYELYITPVGGGRANVALLGSREMVRSLSGQGMAGFKAAVAGELGGGGGAVCFTDEPMAWGPFPARRGRFHRGRLVLTGDAAGFHDGISGEGISLALVSARECAEAVEQALRTGRTAPFRAYEWQVRAHARNSTLLARLNLFLAAKPRLARAALQGLAQRPETFDRLIGINCGDQRFRDLRPRDLLPVALAMRRLRKASG